MTSLNWTETSKTVRGAVDAILSLKDERKEINAAIKEQRQKIKKLGVPLSALDWTIKAFEAKAEAREAHDEAYVLCREAVGIPVQQVLFEADEMPEQRKPKGKPGIDAAREHLGTA